MCFFHQITLFFYFFSSDFCYIVYYLLVLAKFMIFQFSLHKVFKTTISLYYITVCGLNSEFRFGILEYIRITDIICQTEMYCNTMHAYIAFIFYANCIFIITIENTLTVWCFVLDFILYKHVCFTLFSTILCFIYYVFTFNLFTVIYM